jgi:hypothetical protein
MSKFKETKISSQIIYSGFIRVHRDEVLLPDACSLSREDLPNSFSKRLSAFVSASKYARKRNV